MAACKKLRCPETPWGRVMFSYFFIFAAVSTVFAIIFTIAAASTAYDHEACFGGGWSTTQCLILNTTISPGLVQKSKGTNNNREYYYVKRWECAYTVLVAPHADIVEAYEATAWPSPNVAADNDNRLIYTNLESARFYAAHYPYNTSQACYYDHDQPSLVAFSCPGENHPLFVFLAVVLWVPGFLIFIEIALAKKYGQDRTKWPFRLLTSDYVCPLNGPGLCRLCGQNGINDN